MATKREKLRRLQGATFTGRTTEIALFRSLLPLDPRVAGDILAISGIAGIGKTELLSRFHQIAQEEGVTVGRLDPQVQASVFDFLSAFHQQLLPYVRFPQFDEGLRRHQGIEARLLSHAGIPRTALQMLARAAHASAKLIPGVNVVAEAISPEQVDGVISAIYSAVGRKEGDFWMKPEEELTDRLVADLNSYAASRRLVLMIDTYELMGAFDAWVRHRLFANLEDNVLLVIAGHRQLEGKGWEEYAPMMRHIELDRLSSLEVRTYFQKKGIHDQQLVAAMADFSGGHPLTLALLAKAAEQGTLTDLAGEPARREVIHALLSRITQNVAANLHAALEICAVLRVVNEDSLAFMLESPDVRQVFEEVRHFDFVRVHTGGIALHDVAWAAMNEELAWRSPGNYKMLNDRAARFYERALSEPATDRDRLTFERLYHRIRADEAQGIRLFQDTAEELVRFRLIARLRALLADVKQYHLLSDNARAWRDYYEARLASLEARYADAERGLKAIAENEGVELRLQAYALCDWGDLWQAGRRYEETIPILEKSLTIAPVDSKLAASFLLLSVAYHRVGKLEKCVPALEQALAFYEAVADPYGVAYTYQRLTDHFLYIGVPAQAQLYRNRAKQLVASIEPEPLTLTMELLAPMGLARSQVGPLRAIELELQAALDIAVRLELMDAMFVARDLGYIVGMQGRYGESEAFFSRSMAVAQRLDDHAFAFEEAIVRGFRGAVLKRQGVWGGAEQELRRSLATKQQLGDSLGLSELTNALGELHEARAMRATGDEHRRDLAAARASYFKSLDYRWTGRRYHESTTLAGLVRVKYALGDDADIPPLLAAAEKVALQFEYNDHLASLRLVQGHIAWVGLDDPRGAAFDAALAFYREAVVYALRYNRFLLDELLTGRPEGTHLPAIVPHCLRAGAEGQRMLEALRAWWARGTNDVGEPRPETISPLAEGIPLVEAERTARTQEPGDGMAQRGVLEQLDTALATAGR